MKTAKHKSGRCFLCFLLAGALGLSGCYAQSPSTEMTDEPTTAVLEAERMDFPRNPKMSSILPAAASGESNT